LARHYNGFGAAEYKVVAGALELCARAAIDLSCIVAKNARPLNTFSMSPLFKLEAKMKETLLQQGLDLMLFGMATVYLFLSLLVLATGLVSKFLAYRFPEPKAVLPLPAPAVESPPLVDALTEQIIKQAIRIHRRVNSQ
jgi:oxaloacetate decarboxylase (Na+ extruding) subunit gamma